jgi:tetraprenyl-beta-curcumene synthase
MTTEHVPPSTMLRAFALFPWAMLTYWLTIFPTTGRQLRRWRLAAATIPDPLLRRHALEKLDGEHLTAEGAAAFAILASRRNRGRLVRACVAFEVMYDYLDALTEDHPTLENNRALHRALRAAVDLRSPIPRDLYAHHPQTEDGGYLAHLAIACRHELAMMPRERSVAPALVRATERAAEAQSLNHATATSSVEPLRSWAADQQHEGLNWWEIAAAAGAPMVIFGLVAAACDDRTSPDTARAVEHAYFPWVSALEWLLEGLADEEDDRVSGAHTYVSHYHSTDDLAQRLAAIATYAVQNAGRLPRGERHLLLVAGMIGMLLSGGGSEDRVKAATAALDHTTRGLIRPFIVVLRMRRGAKRLRRLIHAAQPARVRRRWPDGAAGRQLARPRRWNRSGRR